MEVLELRKNLYFVGVADHGLDVFDIAVRTKYGTSYNSYLLKTGEGAVLFEGSKATTEQEYLANIEKLVPFTDIKYVFVSHTEPDHSGGLKALLGKNPEITVVASPGALINLSKIMRIPFKSIAAKDGAVLEFGGYHFRSVSGLMLHWPDVMFTYIEELKALVSCDAFGCHYAHDGILMSNVKVSDMDDYWDAFEYYFEKIMGPFPAYVKKAAERVLAIKPEIILTGHGPVLDVDCIDRVEKYITLAEKYAPSADPDRVTIVYGSAYGYTRDIAKRIEEALSASGREVASYEIDVLNYESQKEKILDSIYRSGTTLLGSPTIAGDAVGLFYDLLASLPSTVGTGRKASAFGNYGWSGEAIANLSVRLKQLHFEVKEGYRQNFAMDEAGEKALGSYISSLLA